MKASFVKVYHFSVVVENEVRKFHCIGIPFLLELFQIFVMWVKLRFSHAIAKSVSFVEPSNGLHWDIYSIKIFNLQASLLNTEMSPAFETAFTKEVCL